LAAVLIASAVLPARAETKLTDLNGEWRGSGNDRDLPIESFQPTTCRNTIRADQRRITSDMTCNGQRGLSKVIHLSGTVDNDQIAGSVSQKVRKEGRTAPSEWNGSMTGQKAGDTAKFTVRWGGITPNATVSLVMQNPNSYSMLVTSLGLTIMNVNFTRASDR
jgi:hypothetical protein